MVSLGLIRNDLQQTRDTQYKESAHINLFEMTFFFFLHRFDSLLNLCSLKNQDHLLKLIISTLDYSRDGLARVILSKILTAATDVRNRPTTL